MSPCVLASIDVPHPPHTAIVSNPFDSSFPTDMMLHGYTADGTKDLVEVCNVNWQDLVEQMNDKRAVLEFDANRAKAEKFKPEQFS